MKKILILTTSLFAFYQTSAIAAAPYPQYEALVEKHAALQRLDKNIVWAVMGRESSGNRYALSNKDARGLLQVIPGTAARMGVNPKYLYDPEQNIIAGTRYLRFLCNHFPDKSSSHGCNLDLVLAGYNALNLSRQWGNERGGLPFTVVLDAKGQIQWRHSGTVDVEALRSMLKSGELR